MARVTDETGRVFLYESKDRCEVLPVLTIDFELRLCLHDTDLDIRTHGNNNVLPVEWSVSKDGKNIPLSEAFSGSLTPQEENYFPKRWRICSNRHDDRLSETQLSPQRKYTHPAGGAVYIHHRRPFTTVRSLMLSQRCSAYRQLYRSLTLQKDGNAAQYQGTLDNDGGRIAIRDTGDFTLTASVTDNKGRVTTHWRTSR